MPSTRETSSIQRETRVPHKLPALTEENLRTNQAETVKKIATRSLMRDCISGCLNSRIFKVIAAGAGGAIVGLLGVALVGFLLGTPPGWVITAIMVGCVGSFILYTALNKEGRKELFFEFRSINEAVFHRRTATTDRPDYFIQYVSGSGLSIYYTRHIPNRYHQDGEYIIQHYSEIFDQNSTSCKGVFMAAEETTMTQDRRAFMLPYMDEDWGELGFITRQLSCINPAVPIEEWDDEMITTFQQGLENAASTIDQTTQLGAMFIAGKYVPLVLIAYEIMFSKTALSIDGFGFKYSEQEKIIFNEIIGSLKRKYLLKNI